MINFFRNLFSFSSKKNKLDTEGSINESISASDSADVTDQATLETDEFLSSGNLTNNASQKPLNPLEFKEQPSFHRLNRNMKYISNFSGSNEEYSKMIALSDQILPSLKPENKYSESNNSDSRVVKPLKKLNLCTDLIDYAKRANPKANHSILKNPDPRNLVNLQQYIERLTKSVKFILPNDAVIVEGGKKNGSWKDRYAPYINHYKLPYKSIALEIEYSLKLKVYDSPESEKFVFEDSFLPLIFLCDQNDDHIAIEVFYRETNRQWRLVNRSPIILLNDFTSPFMKKADEYLEDEVASEYLSRLIQLASHVVLDLIMLVNCSNVEITEELSGGKFINEKRIKKGKTPLFDYKVLTLDFASSDSNDVHGVSGSMKRTHLRRGHIRRLKDRTIWVNACTVNGGKKGILHKDYKLSKTTL